MALSKTFTDEDTARAFLEASRWPEGPVCPFCGQMETVKAQPAMGALGKGWYHCGDCRKKFTVRVGTLYERSHIPLRLWLCATHLLTSSKKGISAHQLHRMLGITYKSAWFMAHRIREGMKPDEVSGGTLGGEGKTVEADETFTGRRAGRKVARGAGHKIAVVALVERGGKVRSFKVPAATKKVAQRILRLNVDPKSVLMTDESSLYAADTGMTHHAVNHSQGEYVRGDAHTNTIEGVFSVFKRGMIGTYQHCGEQHLQRYLNEFDFRYSNRAKLGIDDAMRAEIALKGIEGKRLTYRRTVRA